MVANSDKITATIRLRVCNLSTAHRELYRSLRQTEGFERRDVNLIMYGIILSNPQSGATASLKIERVK